MTAIGAIYYLNKRRDINIFKTKLENNGHTCCNISYNGLNLEWCCESPCYNSGILQMGKNKLIRPEKQECDCNIL